MDEAIQGPLARLRRYYRPFLLIGAGTILLLAFWLASRYPQLFDKSNRVGEALPTMAFSSELWAVSKSAPWWERILATTVNWLDSMKIGMTFGVLLGALLHTWFRYYPLNIGRNRYLNSVRGALVGVPMGVCANCAVPVACGITRGEGRIEVALGFLFSSPNFNPVVLVMTFAALPPAMGVTKYAILSFVIVFLVPAVIGWLERRRSIRVRSALDGVACAISPSPRRERDETLRAVGKELSKEFGKSFWMLVKPTMTIMLAASVLSAAALTLIPWTDLLSEVSYGRLALVGLLALLMPVPIAVDVMFAAQLYRSGVPTEYVMLFAMTLGTFSIIPSIYLWREVSRRLAVILLAFFLLAGLITSLAF